MFHGSSFMFLVSAFIFHLSCFSFHGSRFLVQARYVWFGHAEAALRLGEHVCCLRYLNEIERHCRAYNDSGLLSRCQSLRAWMLFLEGEPREVRLALRCNLCALLWLLVWGVCLHRYTLSRVPAPLFPLLTPVACCPTVSIEFFAGCHYPAEGAAIPFDGRCFHVACNPQVVGPLPDFCSAVPRCPDCRQASHSR